MSVFDQIAAHVSRVDSLVVVVIAPRGASIPLVRKRVVSEFRVRDVLVTTLAVDPALDLVSDVQSIDRGSVVLASGLETASEADVREYLRRTSFRRSTLSRLDRRVILVLPEAVWGWVARELPDLARWLAGPFVAPIPARARLLMASRAEVGLPVPPSEHVELDPLRGLSTPVTEMLQEAERKLVVMGGARGVGLTHMAARLQQERASAGQRCVWPPGVTYINGKKRVAPLVLATDMETGFPKVLPRCPTIREWLEEADEDAFLIVTRGWLPNEAIEWLARRRSGLVLGNAQQGLEKAIGKAVVHYLPPVVVHSQGEAGDAGRRALAAVLERRILASGFLVEEVATGAALDRIAYLSGGNPGIAIEMLEVAREEFGDQELDVTKAERAALGLASRMQRSNGRDRFDLHSHQLVYFPEGPREVVHPLLQLLDESSVT